ncbi:hypothetical protein K3495_g6851, partial [Podosphaera aphanis]
QKRFNYNLQAPGVASENNLQVPGVAQAPGVASESNLQVPGVASENNLQVPGVASENNLQAPGVALEPGVAQAPRVAPVSGVALKDLGPNELTNSSGYSLELDPRPSVIRGASDQRCQAIAEPSQVVSEIATRVGTVIKPTPKKLVFGTKVTGLASASSTSRINSDNISLVDPTSVSEVISLEQAMNEDRQGWIIAIIKELKALESTGTFTLMTGSPPNGRKLITSKLVLRHKQATNSTENFMKARIVARGFQQEAGLDYSETFASVVRYNTLRIILAIAAVRDLEIDSVDIDTAFLNPQLREETYMELPPMFKLLDPSASKSTHFLRLNKSLYGLKQAPHEWFMMVKSFFQSLGMKSGDSDPNLFIGKGIFLLLFVDDMLIVGNRLNVDKMKETILKEWKGKDLKATNTFIGIQIKRDRENRKIHIHQTAYTLKLLDRMSMLHCNPTHLPIPAGTTLKEACTDDLLDENESGLYRQIVGSTIYLSNNTRPDIAFPVGQLARFMSKPGTFHLRAAKQLLRYLKGTAEFGIQYGGLTCVNDQYSAWTDATWGTENDRKSFQGYVILWYGGAVTWNATREKSTALSSMEAEIIAASEGARELAWMEKVCLDLEITWKIPPALRIDNQPAVDLAKTTKFHTKA